MKKFDFDRDYIKLCMYLLVVIIMAILFDKIISNISPLKETFTGGFKAAAKIMSPFVYALFISFFLNPFARWLQNKVFVTEKLPSRTKRILSSMVAIVVFISAIVVIIAFILPELIVSLYSLVLSLPGTLETAQEQFELFIADASNKYGFFTQEFLHQILDPFFKSFGTFTGFATKVVTGTLSFGRGVFNFVIGLIIAFYMLIYKDGFKAYWIKIIFAFFKPERADRIIKNCARANGIFEAFFVGKTLDSAIIGILSFIIMTAIIKPKYILLSSVVIGVTNMIPFFGPIIGGIPVVLLNLIFDFKMGLIMAVFILLLQQFDGYILGPKILGDSTGLSPFWVIASILIGGSLMGIVGMFLGVPIFAVIKMFVDEAVEKKFTRKYGRIKREENE